MLGRILADDYTSLCRSGEKTVGKGKKVYSYTSVYKAPNYIQNFTLNQLQKILQSKLDGNPKLKECTVDIYSIQTLYEYLMSNKGLTEFNNYLSPVSTHYKI